MTATVHYLDPLLRRKPCCYAGLTAVLAAELKAREITRSTWFWLQSLGYERWQAAELPECCEGYDR